MAKGYDTNKKRQEELDSLGRVLARRSASKCELCEAAGVPLTVMEVPPAKGEPDVDNCIFICEDCRGQLENPKKFTMDHWHCLNDKVWSETSSVKIMSMRILKKVSESERWAADIMDDVYLDEEEDELVNSWPM